MAALLAALACGTAQAEPLTGVIVKESPLKVTGETLYIGNGSTETSFTLNGTNSPKDAFIIDGGTVVVNKAAITSVPEETQLWVGYEDDRAGHMVVENSSVVDIHTATTLGLYNPDSTLTIKSGSTFTGGYNNFWMYGGTVTVDGEGSRLNLCTTSFNYNYRTLLGVGSDEVSTLNVTNGALITSAATQFVTNFSNDSTVNINVDGEGSALVHEAQAHTTGYYQIGTSGEWVEKTPGTDIPSNRTSGWYDKDSTAQSWTADGHSPTITYLLDSGTDKNGWKYVRRDNVVTNISVTNGGRVEFNSALTYVGFVLDRQEGKVNKMLNINIDKHSKLSFNRMEIYADTTITNDGGNFIVNGDMNIHAGCTITFNVTEANQEKAVITLADGASANIVTPQNTRANEKVTFNIVGDKNTKAGAQYILFSTDSVTGIENVAVTGTEASVDEESGQIIITLQEDIFVGRDPLADVLGAASWGVQKSSQAFTGTLWGGRTNAVVLNTCTTTGSDEKGNVVSTTLPTGRTIAWGTAYGQFSELESCCDAAGADYSIYGAALGVEHQFASSRSIGAALGYDWSKVSPFHAASFDQESMHAAVYGRAGQWKLGTRGALAVDLSAAVGQTESELSVGDVEQDSLQLDARVSYIRSISDKTSVSAFAGLQYYAQSDDSTANVEVGSAQYLRTLAGVGINHAVTEQTTVFAEASVYNDAMRHNPEVMVDGFSYGVANPGRLGGSITAGAAYELNANWTLRGSYSFDAARHSSEHSVNAGAVYKF